MRKWRVAAVLAAILSAASIAGAQTYPSRPITLVAPFPAGGQLDVIARIVTEPMRETLGQPIIIENMSGAGGNLGINKIAKAEPDGYTIGLGQWSTQVVNPVTYDVPYDIVKDFEPVALLTNTPQLIISRRNFPAKDIKELVAWLKANPDKATAATVGVAGGAQVSAVYFQKETGTTFRFVPYRGGVPAITDIMSGQIDLMFDQAANALGSVKSGNLKAYAVMMKDRWAALPEVPSIDESGTPGLYVAYWHAMWAPKGTPKEIIAKLNAAVVRALADPNVKKRLADIGQDVWPREQQTPEALAAYHKAEIDKWWPIIRASGLKAQ
jgi:tripartite-type tricarboxylate transporter receptor subunit TctC